MTSPAGRPPRRNRRWDDPFRSFDAVNSFLSSVGLPSISAGAAAPYRSWFTTLQRQLVGREVTARVGDHELTLTITEFDSPLDPRGLAVGQFGEVRVAAREISWDSYGLDEASAVLQNVHVRPGMPAVLVAAPAAVSGVFPPGVVDAVLHRAVPWLHGELRPDGSAWLRWARRPHWGALRVDVSAAGSAVWFTARALQIGHRSWALPSWIPAFPVRIPELPKGLTLTDIDIGTGTLRWCGLLPQWRIELPQLDDLLKYVSGRTGLLNLPWIRGF